MKSKGKGIFKLFNSAAPTSAEAGGFGGAHQNDDDDDEIDPSSAASGSVQNQYNLNLGKMRQPSPLDSEDDAASEDDTRAVTAATAAAAAVKNGSVSSDLSASWTSVGSQHVGSSKQYIASNTDTFGSPLESQAASAASAKTAAIMHLSQSLSSSGSLLSNLLLAGEHEVEKDSFAYEWNGRHWTQGTFIITNFRLIFLPNNISTYDDVPVFEGSRIPLASIHRIEKIGGKSNRREEHGYLLEVYSKDIRVAKFSFLPQRKTRGRLSKLLRVEAPLEDLFCWPHKAATVSSAGKLGASVLASSIDAGWSVYQCRAEYLRQGLQLGDASNTAWRLSDVNNDFKVSDTYPQQFIVPSSVSDEDIKLVAAFRSKGRIPVLSYYDRETGCVITRAAQPLMGLGVTGGSKRADDYRMIEAIMQAASGIVGSEANNLHKSMSSSSLTYSATGASDGGNANTTSPASPGRLSMSSNRSGDKLMIIDLRPLLNAEANRMFKSAGYERNYKNTELKFMGIANIHVMRKSFLRLMEMCIQTGGYMDQFSTQLEQTGWLEHVRLLLLSAKFCAECMQRDRLSVLVHCSDGWDRTSQVVCLAQMLMDPYFRTFEGFAVLVEKDWLGYGHQFGKRTGHYSKNFAHDERGPIFLQFLDAVWQLLRQFPTAFEYNEQFLIYVMDSVYSCQYGTFLFDSIKEREQCSARERTLSVWTQFLRGSNQFMAPFRNPFYSHEQRPVLWPDCRQCVMQFWDGYYMRFVKQLVAHEYGLQPDGILHDRGMEMLERQSALEEAKTRAEQKNEATVATFQFEIKLLHERIREMQSAEEQLRLKYEQDTQRLLQLCERQKDELLLTSSSPISVPVTAVDAAVVLPTSIVSTHAEEADDETGSNQSTPRGQPDLPSHTPAVATESAQSTQEDQMQKQLEDMRNERDKLGQSQSMQLPASVPAPSRPVPPPVPVRSRNSPGSKLLTGSQISNPSSDPSAATTSPTSPNGTGSDVFNKIQQQWRDKSLSK